MSSFKIHTQQFNEDGIFDGCICYTNFVKQKLEYEKRISENQEDEKIDPPKFICNCINPVRYQTFQIGFSKNNEDYF